MTEKNGVLSLFTGAGGLDLGLEVAGFRTLLCVENDSDAIATLQRNRPEWAIAEPNDATRFAEDPVKNLRLRGLKQADIAVIAGGPPCQPFSKAGNWAGEGPRRMGDPRAKAVHAYLKILEAVRPEVLLFENVPGFATEEQSDGFRSFVRGIRRINSLYQTQYRPQLFRINAADYGVPQLRERVFVVAHKRGRLLELPPATHGPKSPSEMPYSTVWDSIGDLDVEDDSLRPTGRWASLLPSIPEGNNYLWHTPGQGGRPLFGWRTRYWSFLLKLAKNRPAWTLPASPGPAIGPFHWRNRMLSVAEMARLQTFPDKYVIVGGRRSAQRQLGNAVPAALAEFIGKEIQRQLLRVPIRIPAASTLVPRRAAITPGPEPVSDVPREYLHLEGNHLPHPGTGNGPARNRANVERFL